jgi:hypothetical protein
MFFYNASRTGAPTVNAVYSGAGGVLLNAKLGAEALNHAATEFGISVRCGVEPPWRAAHHCTSRRSARREEFFELLAGLSEITAIVSTRVKWFRKVVE